MHYLPFVKVVFHRLSFAFTYIVLVSFSLFFHFALGHEIPEIENWLYYYSGLFLAYMVGGRLLFSFIWSKKKITSLLSKSKIIGFANNFSLRDIFCLLLVGGFNYTYFLFTSNFGQHPRDQVLPRFLILFIIIFIDVIASHMVISEEDDTIFESLASWDCLLAVLGILFFYENFQLNLNFMIFYLGAYSLYLITKNPYSLFAYYLIVLVPLSSFKMSKVDIFSVDYTANFSSVIVFIGHLIPYTWLLFSKKKRTYGKWTT